MQHKVPLTIYLTPFIIAKQQEGIVLDDSNAGATPWHARRTADWKSGINQALVALLRLWGHFLSGVVVKECPSSQRNEVKPTPPSVISEGRLLHWGHLESRCQVECKHLEFLHSQTGG
jgi:hypothetical protein